MLDHNDHCQLKNHLIVVGLFEISLFSVCRSMLSIIIIKMEMEWSIALCTRTHTHFAVIVTAIDRVQSLYDRGDGES